MARRPAVPPAAVALVRGVLLAAGIAATDAVAGQLTSGELLPGGTWAVWVPVLVLAVRTAEGWLIDQRRDPTPQAGLLGGKPAAPIDPPRWVTGGGDRP